MKIEELEEARVQSINTDIVRYLNTLSDEPFLITTVLVTLLGANIDWIQNLLDKSKVNEANTILKDIRHLRTKLWAIRNDLFHIHLELKKSKQNAHNS